MSEVKLIPLRAKDGSVRAYALVDAADFDWLNQWRWFLLSDYAARQERCDDGKQRPIFMHRFILGLERSDPQQGDHINSISTDNRRSNLRVVPAGANAQNRRSNRGSTSQHRGVNWNARVGKWYASARIDGKLHHIGVFDSEDEAGEAAALFRATWMPYAIETVAS